MSSNKKFVSTIFDVFGYSLVGIMAYCFGLALQNYDSQGRLFAELVSYGDLAPYIFILICFQIMFICLFGFSYAKAFFYKAELNKKNNFSENFKEIYKITGNWIEVVLLSLFIGVAVYQVVNPEKFKATFWCTIFFSGLPYIISAMVYRMKSRDISSNSKSKWIKKTKYVLVCPAILMVGVNTYLGSSVLELLNGKLVYYFPIVLFLIFFLTFYLSLSKLEDRILYFVFILCLIVIGVLTYNNVLSMPAKNMFLAVILSIFLSIFECWYIAFRQLKDLKLKEKKFIKVTSYVIAAAPPVVLILYPLQKFGIIYFVSFVLGMILTQFIWFLYILPNVKKANKIRSKKETEEIMKLRKNSGILRAVFGITVLSLLIIDKYPSINIQLPSVNQKLFENYSFLINAVEVIVSAYSLFISLKSTQNIKRNVRYYKKLGHIDIITLFQGKLGAYIFTAIFLSFEQHFTSKTDIYKYSIVFHGFIVFVIVDLVTLYIINQKEKQCKGSFKTRY